MLPAQNPPAALEGLEPRLVRYVRAPEAEAQGLLLELLREEVEPVVDRVLGAWGAGRREPAEVADLRGEALMQILRRLRRLREAPADAPIADLAAYVATVTRNLCWAQLRQRHPERERLRRRLWHLLRRGVGFETWRDAAGRWLCRLSPFAAAAATAAPPARSFELRRFTAEYLERSAGPVAVADLIATAAAELAPETAAPAGLDGGLEDLPDPRRDAASALVWRDSLAALWSEIRLLPPKQAAALLLGLRDAEGRGALIFLPATGTASLRQIAAVLGLTPENLAEIWNELPWPDLRIAEILGVTRQQVINLRKSARERLARRMERGNLLP